MCKPLTIAQRNVDRVVILRLSGTLDGHTAIQLERQMQGLLDAGDRVFLFELDTLDFIASAGVGVLINIQQRVAEDGGGVLLAAPTPMVKEVFAILGLQTLFPIHADTAAALAAAERYQQ